MGKAADIALSAGFDYIGQGIGYGLGQAASAKAYDRSKNMMTRGPTYQMEGFRNAGLNPILAAGKLGGSVPSMPVVAGSGGGSGASIVKTGQQSPVAKQQTKTLKATEEQAIAATKVNNATEAKVKAETENVAARTQETQYGLPYKRQGSDYYQTEEGAKTYRLGERHRAEPDGLKAQMLNRASPYIDKLEKFLVDGIQNGEHQAKAEALARQILVQYARFNAYGADLPLVKPKAFEDVPDRVYQFMRTMYRKAK